MGGWGSGRPEKWDRRPTTQRAHAEDVLDWHRGGKLTAGRVIESGHLLGDLLAGPTLRIEVVQEYDPERPDFLMIYYPRHAPGGRPEEVALEWAACPYGGERPWLRCPGCERRSRKLYLDFGDLCPRMRCRRCLGLAYESQRQDFARRVAERAKRGRQAVGGWLASGLLTPFPDRPKGMHWRTYRRLAEDAMQAEIAWIDMEVAGMTRMSEALHRKHPSLKDYRTPAPP